MGFSRRRKTSTKVDLLESARKEIEYLFLYEIVSKVEENAISDSLAINFDHFFNYSIKKSSPNSIDLWRKNFAKFTPLSRYQFPRGFSLSVNEKPFSNTNKSIKLLNEIIVPYVKKEQNHISVTKVPANMTRFYQPLDLTVNKSAKRFIAKKYSSWYSQQKSDELKSGKSWKRSTSNCVF